MRRSVGQLAALAGAILAVAAACSSPGMHNTAATSDANAPAGSVTTAPSARAAASPSTATKSAQPSQRPSPTPSPSPRTGKPGATNTGVLPGTTHTVVSGNRTYSTTGAVISGKDFRGFVKVTGKNITFKNCIFRGGTATGNGALLDTESGTGTVVQDSEFVPAHPAATLDDIWADNTSIYRANIHGGVDGVKVGNNVLVQDSYIHNMTWFASDPNQGGGPTHNDGVQGFYGDSGLTLRHNNIDMSTTKDANAALQDSTANVHVTNNWLDGGACTLNFDDHGPRLASLYVTNNRFGRHSFYQCPILLSTNAALAQNSGNVWVDTGTPIPPPQQHD
jgi:hypothetical protein